jgi:hypothetical protein
VTASDTPGDYTFRGVLRDNERVDHPMADSPITVEAADPGDGDDGTATTTPPAPGAPTATRSLSSSSVAPGAEITVTVTASDYGSFGAVTETLPAGFTYMSSSLEDSQVNVSGQVTRFTLQGDSNFTYTVTAPMTEDSYTFSGVLRDSTRVDHPMADSTIMVGTAPEPVTPEPVTPEPVTPEPTDPTKPTASRTP